VFWLQEACVGGQPYTAAKVARGEDVNAFVNTGVEVVSIDNVDQFLQ
jgi:hypothetical protein